MKSEEVYNAWRNKKSQIEIGSNFTKEVMNQIYEYEQEKRKPLFDVQRLVELISANPLAKVGLVAAGAVTGIIRIAFVICTFLGT